MRTNENRQREHRPVFLDASGRRQRRLGMAGAVLVVPAVGYVGLLLSTVLGGPTINSPFLPLPDPPAPAVARQPMPAPPSRTTSGPVRPLVADVAAARRAGVPPANTPLTVTTSSPPTVLTKTLGPKPTPVTRSLPPQARGRPTSLPTRVKTAKGKPTSRPIPPRRPIKPLP